MISRAKDQKHRDTYFNNNKYIIIVRDYQRATSVELEEVRININITERHTPASGK